MGFILLGLFILFLLFVIIGGESCAIVKRDDLKYLASFRCEHHRDIKDNDNCFNHPEQGGCCNSCWVRDWATRQLNK